MDSIVHSDLDSMVFRRIRSMLKAKQQRAQLCFSLSFLRWTYSTLWRSLLFALI